MSIQEGHKWGGDFSLYVMQSIAINEGGQLEEVYQQNKFAIDHSTGDFGPYLYPNGFPYLIAPVIRFVGLDFIWLKIFCSLFFVSCIPLLFKLFTPYFEHKAYLIVLVCCN
jgi:hypothetical protein